jgi:hypothetical protein
LDSGITAVPYPHTDWRYVTREVGFSVLRLRVLFKGECLRYWLRYWLYARWRNVAIAAICILAVSSYFAGGNPNQSYGNITVEKTEQRTVDEAWTNWLLYGDDYDRVLYAGIYITQDPSKVDGVPNAYEAADCPDKKVGKARDYLNNALPHGKEVTVVYEEGLGKGQSGLYRYAYVWTDSSNESLNKRLIERGLAAVNDNQDFDQKAAFERAERQAQRNNRGIWQCQGKAGSISDTQDSWIVADEGSSCNNDGDQGYNEDNDRDNDGICDEE